MYNPTSSKFLAATRTSDCDQRRQHSDTSFSHVKSRMRSLNSFPQSNSTEQKPNLEHLGGLVTKPSTQKWIEIPARKKGRKRQDFPPIAIQAGKARILKESTRETFNFSSDFFFPVFDSEPSGSKSKKRTKEKIGGYEERELNEVLAKGRKALLDDEQWEKKWRDTISSERDAFWTEDEFKGEEVQMPISTREYAHTNVE
ncbi:hypothetical protein BLNAU_5575 [Blattamonas nauphoetae]|uniref:Uncharacterized protein n=1 Tax=Blattamonas nauphoetae TaxID=2049346 RepID=A0ABQ9Y717_9EUKA|nr:hypothetical protein BLNAU_5575 [Blattamonas nauphoetae]